jgi:DNA-binding beta-propeller fold protein YncE
MNIARQLLTLLVALLIGAFGASTTLGATSDSLYIGDATDNTIKRFDAQTGAYLGVFVPTSASLIGPRGILHVDRRLLVSNQNVNLKIPGEIDQFGIADGTSLGALVPSADPHAPFAPRGIILGPGPAGPGNSTLYVADFGKAKIGRVARFDVVSGNWLGDLDSSNFVNDASLNPTGSSIPAA